MTHEGSPNATRSRGKRTFLRPFMTPPSYFCRCQLRSKFSIYAGFASDAGALYAAQYLVPVLVMAYTNGMIAFTLWKKREIGEVNEKLVSKMR